MLWWMCVLGTVVVDGWGEQQAAGRVPSPHALQGRKQCACLQFHFTRHHSACLSHTRHTSESEGPAAALSASSCAVQRHAPACAVRERDPLCLMAPVCGSHMRPTQPLRVRARVCMCVSCKSAGTHQQTTFNSASVIPVICALLEVRA